MNGFPEHLDPSLEDYKAFSRLQENPDFKRWRLFAENFQIERALYFIAKMDYPDDIIDPIEKIAYLRGGYDLYQKMMRVVDRADDMIQQLEQNAKEKTQS